jgi:hypothetical protein
MTTENQEDRQIHPLLVSELEDIVFEASDGVLLAAPGMKAVAVDTRAVVEAARAARIRPAQPAPQPRRAKRRLPRRAGPRRVMMRELLVANQRARDLVGKTTPDSMSDVEIEAALARLAAIGMLPDEED